MNVVLVTEQLRDVSDRYFPSKRGILLYSLINSPCEKREYRCALALLVCVHGFFQPYVSDVTKYTCRAAFINT